jgi:hypothetical protein
MERLALEHGRVNIRDGFADGHIVMSVESGAAWIVPQYGTPRATLNHSVRWSEAYDA